MPGLPRATSVEPASVPSSTATPTTVLLIDDDGTTRRFLRVLLERTQKFKVVGEAANGAEGVALAASLLPDVVVLDVEMPVMDGRQAFPLIRKASASAKIVVYSDRVGDVSAPDVNSIPADLLVPKGTDCSTLVPAMLCMTSGDERLGFQRVAGGKRAAS